MKTKLLHLLVGTTLLLPCQRSAGARTLDWSGFQWDVRDTGGAVSNPGPGRYSDSAESVFVDPGGRLHLKIRRIGGEWNFSEVLLSESLGHGRYEFEVESRYDRFADNVVGGMFTYLNPESVAAQTTGAVGNGIGDTPHEIDIELTRAFGGNGANLFYTTHDPDVRSPSKNFLTELQGSHTTHRFTWDPEFIQWNSYHGHVAGIETPPHPLLDARSTTADAEAGFFYDGPLIPEDLNERVLINFWALSGSGSPVGPSDGREHELIVSGFQYTPLSSLPVPEPSSAALAGLVALTLFNRRESRSAGLWA